MAESWGRGLADGVRETPEETGYQNPGWGPWGNTDRGLTPAVTGWELGVDGAPKNGH